jgi:hypothetical protein
MQPFPSEQARSGAYSHLRRAAPSSRPFVWCEPCLPTAHSPCIAAGESISASRAGSFARPQGTPHAQAPPSTAAA